MRKRIVSMLMLLVLCFSFVPHVQAAEEVTQKHILQVKRVEGEKETDENLLVLRIGDTWYAEQESLAELVGCKATYNENTGIIGFVRQSPSIILCTFKEEECVRRSDNWYVPLQEATCKTGLEFSIENGHLYAIVWRTPRDIENLLSETFRLERLNLTTLMLSIPEGVLIADWEFAKLYAVVTNIWNPSNWVKVLSGYDTLEQYEQIMAQILTNGEDTTGLFATLAEGDEVLNKSAKVSKVLWEILMAYPKLCAYLNSDDGENKELYESLVKIAEFDVLAQLGSLGELKEFLDTYKEVGDAIPLTESLKMFAFLELAGDANDALLHAMDLVFSDSENEDAKAAAVKIKAYHDKKTLALPIGFTDLGLRYINFFADKVAGETIKDILDGKTLFFNVGKILTKIETLILDEVFHVSDAADFIQYLPIYSSIQLELSGYYWKNIDSTIQDMYDLRSCGIMYVKAVLSACENLEFDKSLKKTVEAQKTTAKNYLTSLLSYTEEEYAPTYTNEELITYLQTTYPKEQEVAARWRNAEELVAEHRYWSWTVGVTTAGHYYVELHEDNSARLICSSAISYVDKEAIGGYEEPVGWSYADGVLTICGIDHYWNGEEFLTDELYEMQSPTIQRPLRFSPAVNAEECAEYFRFVYNDTTSAPTSVPTTPTPDVVPSQDQEAANRWKYAEDLLAEYEYWDWQRGYNAESWFPVKLYRDGTAESIEYVPPRERIDDSEWWYADGVLHIFGDEYHWNGNCFESSGEYETSEGSYLTYYLHPDTDGNVAAEFERAYRSINGSQETSTTAPTETWNPSINDMLEVGDYIAFGTYERDNDLYNGPEDLPWIVLDKIGDEVLLISRFVLDCDVYHSEKDTSVQWSNSELRYWLNNTFYQQTFSEEEKAKIIEKEVRAESNPDYGTYAGANTRDKVTLLSISEAKKYFPSNSDRACKATEYAIAQGVQVDNNGNSWWWLRTPGQLDGYAAGVFRNGEVDPIGDIFCHEGDGIRPVIWVNFDKEVDADGDATYTVDAYSKDTSAEDLSTLSAEELEWFTEAYPYNDEGYIELMDEDGAPYSCADFTGYIIPWTAQYSEDHCCVLVRIMSAVEILESQYSSDYAKRLKVGDTIQLDELGPITIERIDWQNEICTINDLYTLSYKPDEDVYVFRMSRTTLTRYGERGMLAWIPVGEYTNFIESGGQDFDPETDSYRRYIETYGGWKVVFTLYDDRCTWMYESGLAG